ncbi:MAG: HipA N-terminal domain-containing protein [Verrucomicrobia bacterium]|nr:HipA N-terminal domain-containing protein [Verrucomicrobiota bacterium]
MRPLRKARVMFKETPAGFIEETGEGYRFVYDSAYLAEGSPVAVTFPLREQPYESKSLFPFFRGLLPEGWFREIVCRTLKIDSKDEFGLLVKACSDCVGAVWIKE